MFNPFRPHPTLTIPHEVGSLGVLNRGVFWDGLILDFPLKFSFESFMTAQRDDQRALSHLYAFVNAGPPA